MHRVMQFCSHTTQSLFHNLTFKRKLIITYLLISIIPVLIVGIVSFGVSNKMIVDMKSEMVEKEFINYAEKISAVLQDVESVSVSLFSNEYIQNSLAISSGIDDIKKSEFYNSIAAVSMGILNSKKYISLINIFGKNGLHYKSQAYTTDLFYDYKSFKEYMGNNHIKGINKWYGTEIFNIFNSKRHKIMNIKVIRDINSLNELGILVLSVDEIYLRNIYGNNNNKSLICDGSGKVISHMQDTEINSNIKDTEYFKMIVSSENDTGSFLYNVKGKKTLVSYSKIKGFGWYIVNFLDYGTILKESSKIGNVTLLIIIVCFQISIFMALLISRNLTKPIINLKSLMAQVEEGNLEVHFKKRNNDEISILGENFNTMIDKIKSYIKEVKHQERLKKNFELNLLQAQINPHMLYNTLDTIQGCIEEGNIEKISSVTKALSTFFKSSLSKGDMFILLRKEIVHLQSYIEVQKLCSEANITLDVQIDEYLLNFRIIKHTLQPIIENSIIHGFRGYQDEGRILIKALDRPHENVLILTVEDNGMGLLLEEVEKINVYLDTDIIEDENKPFGIKNVNDRIRHFYGEGYGLKIESEFGCYTRVHIRIPRMMD